MKIRISLFYLVLLIIPAVSTAQEADSRTLINVDGKQVTAGEFIRMYRKSNDPGNKQDIDEYLQQYIVFKLKVADALSEGIDTTKAFRNELKGYRAQLAQNYLTDNQAKEKLLQRAYQRSLTEINAWHILISCPEGAKPEDTLLAWQKAAGIKERIARGEPFEQVARGSSDDPSVRINGGNLGYFTVFQMIMPFEDAAYNLKKGSVSDPVRTAYGYHIIKAADRRAAKGKILVAHIMKMAPPGAGENELKQSEEAINTIYKELQSGASFTHMAEKYSDHKESASSGGRLNWFGSGEIISDFAEAAFAIDDTGKYTKPVRTTYGWHIIKLLDRRPTGSFEEMRSFLESKINQSYLNSISKKSFVARLKKDHKFRINQTVFDWFVNNTDTLIIQGLKKYDRTEMPTGYIYSFANKQLSTREFVSYIEKRGPMIITDDPVFFINESVEALLSDQIIRYEDSVLEKKYPEFRYLMDEFHDGILLFEISGLKVWNRILEDSVGFRNYYEKNKSNFLTSRGIDAKIYTLKIENGDKKLSSAFNKYSKKPQADILLQKKFNKKNDSVLVITEGKWLRGDDPVIDALKWAKGTQKTRISNFPAIITIKDVLEPVPLPLDEVQSEMMTGYQEYLENEWIRQLKERYTVKIDDKVLGEVKKRLGNE
jgi:peptidyl-prolyl cis-trans isomerase SurA